MGETQKVWAVERRANSMNLDTLLPEETIAIRKQVRDFADRVLRPIAHELNTTPESRDGFRHDVFNAMAEAGLYEIPYPTDVGGLGLEYPTLATLTVLEEIAYYSPGIASAMYDGQAILVGTTLDKIGGPIRAEWLPKLIKGEFVGSFATSEPEASTELSSRATRTKARRVKGGWRLNGRKRWITNSVVADRAIILCLAEGAMSTLFVDMHSEGVTVTDPDLKMGNHAQLTADIIFDNVFVPDEDMLGQTGDGLRTMLGALALGRLGIGAVGVGMAQRAIDVAAHYTSQREVFDQPIARFQHWQFKFAEHAMEIEATRTLYQKASLSLDKGGNAEPLAAMVKVKGSTLAVDVARDAIQACGGYGFARHMHGANQSWPLESIYRDAKIGEIYEGANEVQKWVIARHLLGRNITG
ncbi:MAG: acyl-CoA dehydrogenase family protein [Hyphomonas sp.]